MKVLIYNKSGFVKYIPLIKSLGNYDYEVNEEIMSPDFLKKLKSFFKKKNKKLNINFDLPFGVNKASVKLAGCAIITMDKAQYESQKNEIMEVGK